MADESSDEIETVVILASDIMEKAVEFKPGKTYKLKIIRDGSNFST